jgi:hypothetical protein
MVDVVNDDDCEDDLYIGDDGADILVGIVTELRVLLQHADGLRGRNIFHLICPQDADGDEDIDIVDDGSNLDADTKRFDQIVGVLEGGQGLGCPFQPASLHRLRFHLSLSL